MPRFRNAHEFKVGSTTRAFTLKRNADGTSMYSVREAFGEDAVPFILEPSFDDWKGGHGQRDYDPQNPDKYAEGQSVDSTQDRYLFGGPKINQVGISGGTLGATPVKFVWFDAISKWMCATSVKVFWYDGTNFVEKVDLTAVGTITDMVIFKDILYVALGSSVLYRYSSDGATYTATDLTDGYADKFLVSPNSAGTASVLWKSKLPNEIASTTDGRTVAAGGSQWTSANYIGDTSADITKVFLLNDLLLIGKTDNFYNLDSDGGVHPTLDDLMNTLSTNNFKYTTKWASALYASLGTQFCEVLSANTFDVMGPIHSLKGISKSGICIGLTADNDWLYAIVDEGTNNIIYKGREKRREGGLRWEWCPWVFLSTNACSTAQVVQHTTTDRRLWFGYGNYAAYVKISDNPLAETSWEFAQSFFLFSPYLDAGKRNWDKLLQYLITETEGCGTNVKWVLSYRKDAETSFTSLTADITTNGTVQTYLTTALSCKRIQFKLAGSSNADASTPKMSLFQVRGVLKPETIRIHEAVYEVGQDNTTKTATLRSFFRTARTTTSLIKFADLRYGESTAGTSYVWVEVLPGYPREVELVREAGKEPELGLQVRFREVDFTVS